MRILTQQLLNKANQDSDSGSHESYESEEEPRSKKVSFSPKNEIRTFSKNESSSEEGKISW